jgi:hypothetical protein
MPYVHRDSTGQIESVHRAAGQGGMEYLDASDGEIVRFFRQAVSADSVALPDSELMPVLEALADLILSKRLVPIEELPPDAQAKWLLRKERRVQVAKHQFEASGFVEVIDDSTFDELRNLPPLP